MDVLKNVKKCIAENSLLSEGDKVVLGLSGGPDSVCLYDILLRLGYDVYPVHINHKFRPGDAEIDQKYCEDLTEGKVKVFTYDCPEIQKKLGITSEEAGRKVRYESYDSVASELAESYIKGNIKIALAHNANDQAETVLFRIIRGTGIDGLKGMDYQRKSDAGFDIVRPLLSTSRKDIEEYLLERKIEPRIDKTNLEPIYTRNKIRLELIPFIEKNFNENIIETLVRLSDNAREDSKCLLELATLPEKLDAYELRKLNPAIRHRIYIKALNNLGLEKDITKVHLNSIDEIVFSDNGKSWTPIKKEYKAVREHSEILFKKEK